RLFWKGHAPWIARFKSLKPRSPKSFFGSYPSNLVQEGRSLLFVRVFLVQHAQSKHIALTDRPPDMQLAAPIAHVQCNGAIPKRSALGGHARDFNVERQWNPPRATPFGVVLGTHPSFCAQVTCQWASERLPFARRDR